MKTRRTRARHALGLGRPPALAGRFSAHPSNKAFYKRREQRQKATLAAVGAAVAFKAGRVAHRRRKAKRGPKRDSKGRFK